MNAKDKRAAAFSAERAIGIAAIHVGAGKTSGMRDSAALRLDDAKKCAKRGDYYYAILAAKDSVDYSLGVGSAASAVLSALLAITPKS